MLLFSVFIPASLPPFKGTRPPLFGTPPSHISPHPQIKAITRFILGRFEKYTRPAAPDNIPVDLILPLSACSPDLTALLHTFFYLFSSSSRTADWEECARDAARRVNVQPDPSLFDTAPTTPESSVDHSDSDSDSAGGGPAAAAFSVVGDGGFTDDEETGHAYYGGGAIAMVREVSGGARVDLGVGESSRLVGAAVPRRSYSGSNSRSSRSGGGGGGSDTDEDSVNGLVELEAGEKSRLVPAAAAATAPHF